MPDGFFLHPLYTKSLRDRRRGILGWCLGIAAIVAVQMSVYPSVRSSAGDWQALIDNLPEAFQKILRMVDYSTGVGYLSAELMTFVMPIIFIGLGASWGARLTTEDEEGGTADVLLSLPVRRGAVVTSRLAAVFTVLLVTATTMGTSLATGAFVLDMDIAMIRFLQVSVVQFLLGSFAMSISAALGSMTGRRGIALGVAMSVSIALFVLYSLAPLVDVIEAINPYNPLQWSMGMDALRTGLHWGDAAATIGLTSVLVVVTYRMFATRDIH